MTTIKDVQDFVLSSLEASIYAAPTDHGLTVSELVQLGQRFDLFEGEIHDALTAAHKHVEPTQGRCRLVSPPSSLGDFIFPREPEPRSWEAFEFINVQLRKLARQVTREHARVDRAVLVARGEAEGHSHHDLEVAITLMLLTEQLELRDGSLGYVAGRERFALPSVQVQQRQGDKAFPTLQAEWLSKVLPLIPDILARRSDGRPRSIEPIEAFAEQLSALGHAPFAIWWRQIAAELGLADPARMPTMVTVLSAALAEACLALVVQTAQRSGRSMKKNLPDPPRQWKFEQLAKAAKTGPHPILDEAIFLRCVALNEDRQRIHAGRLLEVYTGALPDFRPEEGREAKATLDLLVRRVLDWLANVTAV